MALYRPKKRVNLGTTYRSCEALGASFIQLVGSRYRKQKADVSRAWRSVPLFETEEIIVPFGCSLVAVELADNAQSLTELEHPRRAVYLFGPEDGTLPPALVAECAHVTRIPGHLCLNLACAVTVVLYDRIAKQGAMTFPREMSTRTESPPRAFPMDTTPKNH